MGHNSDPYIVAHFTPHTPPSDQHPPFPLTFRTTTERRTRNPEWNEAWHLGGIPQAGFDLIVKIYDEDKPGDFDDRLGIAEFSMDNLPSAGTSENESDGQAQEFVLKIKKRKASRRAYATTYLVAWCNADFKKQRGRVRYSVSQQANDTGYNFCAESRKVNVYSELSLRTGSHEMVSPHISNDCTPHIPHISALQQLLIFRVV